MASKRDPRPREARDEEIKLEIDWADLSERARIFTSFPSTFDRLTRNGTVLELGAAFAAILGPEIHSRGRPGASVRRELPSDKKAFAFKENLKIVAGLCSEIISRPSVGSTHQAIPDHSVALPRRRNHRGSERRRRSVSTGVAYRRSPA
mgnify:FL=1